MHAVRRQASVGAPRPSSSEPSAWAPRWLALALALGVLPLVGCLPKLAPQPYDAGPRPDAFFIPMDGAIPPVSGNFTHRRLDDGSIETLVDATSTTAWHYLDLETGEAVMPADPKTDHQWDLAFWRYVVLSNGGVSGTGGAHVARLEGTSFEAVTRAPEEGWIDDAPDGPDDLDDAPDSAFANGVDDWFHYDLTTHILTPRTDVVFVVVTPSRNYFKLVFFAYYDAVGTPAYVRFRWAPVDPPESMVVPDAGVDAAVPDAGPPDAGFYAPPDAVRIEAGSGASPVYFDLDTLSVIRVAHPEADLEWDLAFSGTTIRTNSGTSGPGLGGSLAREGVPYDAVTSTGTLGFVPDGAPDRPSPLASWFERDGASAIRPRDVTYVVQGARGGYSRMRIWHYEEGVYWASFEGVDAAPETVELVLDASDPASFRYVDLHRGVVVSVPSPSTSRDWDLGLSGARIRTNSGVSGPGGGGALDALEPSFIDLRAAPRTGYVEDVTLPDPLAPSESFDGNPALSSWYDVDPMTHALSPRATSFVVRLADGSFGKLEVRAWSAGRFTLGYAYAGPFRTRF